MGKKQFKAESKRLLDLMINSIYTNKEIFLREIISNASDAIDKLCYLSLTDEHVGLSRSDYKIDIIADKEARTLTVRDNGIGMSMEEAENNLGVIARSGSLKFKGEMDENRAEGEDLSIIGQFGVAFILLSWWRMKSPSSPVNMGRSRASSGRAGAPRATPWSPASAPPPVQTSSCT